jgi:hypothetical protein
MMTSVIWPFSFSAAHSAEDSAPAWMPGAVTVVV